MSPPAQATLRIDDDVAARNKLKKAPSAFRTISEVADDLHIPQHVLRFWETKFTQVKPLKRGGGRRYYRPEDIVLLRRISNLLYTQGYTIKGVQRLLREGGGKLGDDIPPAPAGLDAEDADSEGLADAALETKAAAVIAPAGLPRGPRGGQAAIPIPLHAWRTATLSTIPGGRPQAVAGEDEAIRLRRVLSETMIQLEALKAQLAGRP